MIVSAMTTDGQPMVAAGDAVEVADAKAAAPAAAESTIATTAGRSSHAGSTTSLAAKSRDNSSTLPTASTTATGSSHHAGEAPPKPIQSAHARPANVAVIRAANMTREPNIPDGGRCADAFACSADRSGDGSGGVMIG